MGLVWSTHAKTVECIDGVLGLGLAVVLAALDSEEHSRSARVRRNTDQGTQKEKLGNLARLVQEKNIRSKDGNNSLTHKAFLRRL